MINAAAAAKTASGKPIGAKGTEAIPPKVRTRRAINPAMLPGTSSEKPASAPSTNVPRKPAAGEETE